MFSKELLIPLAAGAALFATAAGASVPTQSPFGAPANDKTATEYVVVADDGAPTDPKCPRAYYLEDGECRPLAPGDAPG